MSTHSNPYIGPRPFKKDEADRFFGREREARDLLALVSSQRLVLFYASSGAGKSSLINARLIHALTDRGFEVLPVGRVTGMLPSETGIDLANANVFAYLLKQSLAEYALTGALSEADQAFFREYADASLSEFLLRLAHVGQDEQGNERYVFTAASTADAEIAAPPPEGAAVELKPRALIIDQFEEIFTTNLQAWEQRGNFFSQIRQAMEDDPYLWIVLAMREDFIANLDPLAHLLPGELHARYYMQRMGYDAALEAVKKPVSNPEHREWFRPFPSRVAERLVDNLCLVRVTTEDGKNMAPVKGEFIEPVQLQVVCYQLWEQLRDTPGATITNADLDRLAGGQDLSVFVDRALSEFYEQVLRRVLDKAGDLVDEMELRRWFSERLITEAGTRSFVYRGESETGGLPNEVVRLIAAEFLIRSESRAGGAWYELSHDRFVDPIRRSNQRWSLEQLQRDPLLRRAHEWAASNPSDPGQRDQRLLLNDDELAALDLAGRPVEPVMHEFLEASQQAKKDRDLAAARQQQQAALQRERTARRLLWAFAGLLMVALLATVVAGWQWNDAKTAEATAVAAQTVSAANEAAAESARREAAAALSIARSLELANQSQSRKASSPEDGLLLALAANTYTSTLPSDAASAYSSTLLANTALLDALDYSYRLGNGEAYVPQSLDFAGGGPWAAIAFNNDGHLLALGDNEGGITLWNNATGEAIGPRLVAHGAYPVSALTFDPRGPRLISATGDRNDPAAARHDLVLWDLSDPAHPTRRALAAQQPAIWSAAWSPDGQQVAVANQDGTVDLWGNLSSNEPISRTLPGRHSDWAYSVAFSPDGSRLASAGRDGVIILWSELGSSAPISQTLTDHTAWVNVVAFNRNGTQLASGSDDGTLRLWDLTADPILGVVRDNHYDQGIEVWDLAFSADDRRLAAGWGDNLVRVYDLTQPDAAPWELTGHGGEVMALAFDPAAPQRLVSLGFRDAAPLAWERSEFATTQPFTAPISATLHSIATAGRWLAVSAGSADSQTAFIGDSMSSSPAITLPTGMAITAAALSADGQRLALAGCKAGSAVRSTPTPASNTAAMATPSPGSTTPTPTPKPAGASSSDRALTDCTLTIWSVDPALPITRTHTIPSSQPILAVAFRPERPDQLALATESGVVQIYSLFTPIPENLSPSVPGIADLAFSSDGRVLAALSRTGVVKVWDWTTKALDEEYDFDVSGKQYDAIEFLNGDAWLALAAIQAESQPSSASGENSNVPSGLQLELWQRGAQPQLVTTFQRAGQRATDLAFDPVTRSLIWLQPQGLTRWPMDPAGWLELACTRAGRNLSYDAWRTAFPAADKNDFGDALVCRHFPLDRSFADASVKQAREAIDDCTPDRLDDGMKLLNEAQATPVAPPLTLDSTQVALEVLGAKALEHLGQSGELYDGQAEACLRQAADLLGPAAFDVEQALQAGNTLLQAEEQLADPQADAGPVVHDLEQILEANAPWPDDTLQKRTRALLPDAYDRLCQQGDDAGCQRFAAVADLLQHGATVTGAYQAGVEEPFYFQGQRGQAVTIAMKAVDNAFDTLVRLEGPEGELTYNDDFGGASNSQISNYLLPQDGIYRIIPTAWGSMGSGNYRLSLQVSTPRPITLGDAIRSTTARDSLWQFDGQTGQLVAVTLDTEDPSFDPYLTLYGPDLAQLRYDDDSGGGLNALIVTTLPKDGRYTISAGREGSNAPYTLSLTASEPRTLPLDRPVTSSTRADPLWAFDGAAGQAVEIALDSADRVFTPELHLLDAAGNKIASASASGGDLNARIVAFPLPADGRYFVRPLPADSPITSTLTLRTVTPRAIAVGEPASSTLGEDALWTFDGVAGQPIDIRVTADNGETASVALWTETGQQLTAGGQSMPDAGADIDGYILPAPGRYLVRIDGIDPAARYELTVATARTRAIQPGDVVTSTMVSDTLWTLDAVAGQALDIAMSTTDSSFDPYLTIYDASGVRLASDDDSGGSLNARISLFVAPATGRYVVRAGRPGYGATPYTLSVHAVQPPQIALGETNGSTTREVELWQFHGQAGQVVEMAMSTTDPSFDPYLTLFTATGQRLAENDNIAADNYNARIASFLLPQTGVYYIQTGRAGSTAPYSLALTEQPATPVVPGQRWQVRQNGAYTLAIDRPMRLRINADQPADFTLVGPEGELLTSGAPAILRSLGTTGVYTLGINMPIGASPRWLTIEHVQGVPRRLGAGSETPGRLRPGTTDFWTLTSSGQRADHVTATATGFTPLVELWAPDGALLAAGAEVTSLLPADGDSMLTLRATNVTDSGAYTLTVQPAAIAPGPQACISSGGAADYLPVQLGSTVVLSRPQPLPKDTAWDPARNAYLGRLARVTSLAGADWLGCPVVYVDLDQGQNLWRVRDMAVIE